MIPLIFLISLIGFLFLLNKGLQPVWKEIKHSKIKDGETLRVTDYTSIGQVKHVKFYNAVFIRGEIYLQKPKGLNDGFYLKKDSGLKIEGLRRF